MRKNVPRLEKVFVGLIVLVLAGLVGLFAWDLKTATPDNPFADVTRQLNEAVRPPEAVAAGYLMPTGERALRRTIPARLPLQILAPAGQDVPLPPGAAGWQDLATAAETYQAKQAIAAEYDVGGTTVRAIALETPAPQWAFGLCGARRPADARQIAFGGDIDGWQTDRRGAFWAGRFYVEVAMDDTPAGQADPAAANDATSEIPSGAASASNASVSGTPSNMVAASDAPTSQTPTDAVSALLAQLAGVQVAYGRPFEAEALLPTEGLDAASLRFVAERPLGVDALAPAFVADYDGRVEVAIAVAGSTGAAERMQTAVVESLATPPAGETDEPQDIEGEPDYTDEESYGTDAAEESQPALTDDNGIARGTLPDGRTVMVRAMDRYLVAVAAPQAEPAATLLAQIQPPQVVGQTMLASAPQRKAGGLLPVLAEPDLAGPGEVRTFGPDTLYEKINGKAQLYHSYNFAELLFTTYAAGEDAGIDLYVYDMGQPDNAFGIYRTEQGDGGEPADVGRNGYLSGSSVFFWKGKYYVNLLAAGVEPGHESEGGDNSDLREIALKLARAVADALPEADQSLWADKVLPAENRVPDTFEFRKSDVFGLSFLHDVFTAQYAIGDGELTLFVMRNDNPQQAAETFEQYKAFAGRYGKVLDVAEIDGATVMTSESIGTYDVIFVKDTYLGGATAAEDLQTARDLVTEWVTQMQ